MGGLLILLKKEHHLQLEMFLVDFYIVIAVIYSFIWYCILFLACLVCGELIPYGLMMCTVLSSLLPATIHVDVTEMNSFKTCL